MNKQRVILPLSFLLLVVCCHSACAGEWPQAAGPNHDWTVTTDDPVPVSWSAEKNENIRWRMSLPETGQSGIAVWKDRLFLSTMKPLPPDATSKKGSDIVIYCVDARHGKILWQHDLPGDPKAPSSYAYGFSSSSSPTPITDGRHVWFWNASGRMGCWTVDGQEVWVRQWTPTIGRPFNKQYEPIKIGDTILNVEPLDPDDPKRREDAWNYLRAFDAKTGSPKWTAYEGLTHYNTPVLGKLPDGGFAVLAGRGAHHGTPESPAGLTLTRVDGSQAGQTVWNWKSLPEGKAHVTQSWDQKYSYWLDETRTDLVVLNTKDGSEAKRISWIENVSVTSFDSKSKSFTHRSGVNLSQQDPAITVFPAWHANLSIYPYVYFQCFSFQGKRQGKAVNFGPRNSIARINVETESVEYLELPFSVPDVEGATPSNNGILYPKMTINSRGIDVADDVRSGRDGRWWCFNGNTIAVNQYLYFTFMCGKVQVIDGKAERFDERALVSFNDLGRFGETWSVNTPSYSNGRLYHRTMRELFCIEAPADIPVTAPPEELELPPFYQKYVSANGYPIVGSAKVNDYAMKEAAYLANMMLAKRPDVKQAMIDGGSRLVVMAHSEFTTDVPEHSKMSPKDFWDARARGLGGSRRDPVCSCGEENLLGFQGDPYATECILIHEFAHNIHLRGMVVVDATFDDRLKQTYDRAMAAGLWKTKYASVNHAEYFAEGVQSWFNNNRPPDHDHNHVDTRKELREYDPGLAALCEEVFGDTELVYAKPATRLTGHLKGYDPAKAPRFVWPKRLETAIQEIREKARNRGKE